MGGLTVCSEVGWEGLGDLVYMYGISYMWNNRSAGLCGVCVIVNCDDER